MSYNIAFKVKVEGIDRYIEVGDCSANVTWNLRKMIEAATSLPWLNEENNGLCVDVIPAIMHGYKELLMHPEKYEKYESPNGWGTVEGCKNFFEQIIEDWEEFSYEYPDLVPIAAFFVE